METVGYIFGLVSFVMCIQLSSKISKLERSMKQVGIGREERDSLKEVIERNIDKKGIIKFEKDTLNMELNSKQCFIIDADEEWVLLKLEKKNTKHIIRINSIKNIEFLD